MLRWSRVRMPSIGNKWRSSLKTNSTNCERSIRTQKVRKVLKTYVIYWVLLIQNLMPCADFIGERRTGINQSVTDDVAGVFKGKTMSQLSMLHEQIKKKLKGGEGVDVGALKTAWKPVICRLVYAPTCDVFAAYWESLLQQLKAHMARMQIRDRHQEQLRRKLLRLKQQVWREKRSLQPHFARAMFWLVQLQQGIDEGKPLFPIIRDRSASNSPRPPTATVTSAAAASTSRDVPSTSAQAVKTEGEAGASSESDDEPVITEQDLVESGYNTSLHFSRYKKTVFLGFKFAELFFTEWQLKRKTRKQRCTTSTTQARTVPHWWLSTTVNPTRSWTTLQKTWNDSSLPEFMSFEPAKPRFDSA